MFRASVSSVGCQVGARRKGPGPLIHCKGDRGRNYDQTRFFSSCMFRPRPRISLVNTSKLAGVPASSVFSPLTMLS